MRPTAWRLSRSSFTRVGRPETRIVDPPTVLDGIPTIGPLGDASLPTRPDIPLSQHDLLVNARGEPHLAAELKKEIASADRIDIIVAFVRWYGVRLLIEPLEEALRRHIPIRLLTTTYTGSTERVALDRLAELGVDVAVSYDTAITRLHAKAWLFHRKTGFSTAYIGSSNLTRSALLDGREWNVRVSADASPALFAKVSSAFDAHWASHDFEAYDPTRDHERLDRALNPVEAHRRRLNSQASRSNRGRTSERFSKRSTPNARSTTRNATSWSHRPAPARPSSRPSTTGGSCAKKATDLSLLVVAHRETLLTQSRRTFREALSDGSFGELYVGGHRPEDGRHVFASIQTLHANDPSTLDPTAFDVVIVDEFHHAEAQTYRALLDHLEPKYLLALTATPERADGLDVRRWTDNRTAFDMRLWHTLDRQLLAPFQYFGVADTSDLSSVALAGRPLQRRRPGRPLHRR